MRGKPFSRTLSENPSIYLSYYLNKNKNPYSTNEQGRIISAIPPCFAVKSPSQPLRLIKSCRYNGRTRCRLLVFTFGATLTSVFKKSLLCLSSTGNFLFSACFFTFLGHSVYLIIPQQKSNVNTFFFLYIESFLTKQGVGEQKLFIKRRIPPTFISIILCQSERMDAASTPTQHNRFVHHIVKKCFHSTSTVRSPLINFERKISQVKKTRCPLILCAKGG